MFNKAFGRVVQLAVSVAAVLTAALPYPATLSYWPRLMVLAAWSITIVSIRPNQRWSKIFIIASVILGFGCGFVYWILIDYTAIEYNGKVYIRGELTKEAKAHIKDNPTSTEKNILVESYFEENWLWEPDSRIKNRIILGFLYSAYIFFFGIALLGALEKIARSDTQSESDNDEQSQDNEQTTQDTDQESPENSNNNKNE